MSETYKMLNQSTLTTTAAAIVTVAATHTVFVKHIRVVNNDTTINRNITIWQAGTGVSNIILPLVPVDAGGWAEFEGTIILNSGTTLYASAGAGDGGELVMTTYGLEVSN